ncbi:MAG: hydrogenase maturation protease [Tepidisphaeraceae bacterium]
MSWNGRDVPRVLLIGYGNDLRRDDGVGVFVAKQLEEHAPTWTVIVARQLLPEHAEQVAEADLVVFIDAAVDVEAGTVRWTKVLPAPHAQLHAHRLDPPGLIALAGEALGRAPSACWLVRIGAASLDLGESLSPVVAAAARRVVKRIPQVIRSEVQSVTHA